MCGSCRDCEAAKGNGCSAVRLVAPVYIGAFGGCRSYSFACPIVLSRQEGKQDGVFLWERARSRLFPLDRAWSQACRAGGQEQKQLILWLLQQSGDYFSGGQLPADV